MRAKKNRFHLSLGSNLGDRRNYLGRCRRALTRTGIKIMNKSSVYETQPVGDLEQPWFLNQVVEIVSELEPDELLLVLNKIENRMGRERSFQGSPRTIDIDILLAEDRIMTTKDLEIPHPRLELRKFVLTPLREIAPDTVHPKLKLDVKTLWKKCPDTSRVRLYR